MKIKETTGNKEMITNHNKRFRKMIGIKARLQMSWKETKKIKK